MKNQAHTTRKLIGVAIASAAIGGLLGLLFAPHKGKKTRKKILGLGTNMVENIKEKMAS